MSALAEDIAGRATDVRERIAKAGGDPARVRIVAVTKGFGPDVVAAAFAAGLTEFGENYADELIAKWDTLGRRATWHFLGTVQRNKIPRLAGYVDCWQAVARVVEGEAIKRRRAEAQGESSLTASVPPACSSRLRRPDVSNGAAVCRRRFPASSRLCRARL